MNILIACEQSQRVCSEFLKLNHNVFSCDLVNTTGKHINRHIVGDVTKLLNGDCKFITQDGNYHYIDFWDMIIAFPPYTYMTNAGACRMYKSPGVLDKERFNNAMLAKELFMTIYNSKCEKIAIENPKPLKVIGLPQVTHTIEPYEFGHPYSKKTYLWLKNLPPLMPTELVAAHLPYVSGGSFNKNGKRCKTGKVSNKVERSLTFIGIAEAMADQWG